MRVSAFPFLVAATAAVKPNIVILFADDMGYGDLTHTGNPTIVTPNLDRLVAEGMRFTQWHSAHPLCSPSRAGMLTGRIPVRSGCSGANWAGGVFKNDAIGGLPENETTVAEMLGAHGYASIAIGKWHLGQQERFLPVAHGFDEYFGIPYSVDMAHSAWMDEAFGAEVPLPLIHNTQVVEQPVDLSTLDKRYAAKAVDFITKNTKAEQPFLLYFACNHVHIPNYASEEFCNVSKRGRFGDAMAEMDASFGTIMAGLKDAGADENTIVFFTSDNGPWLTQHKNGGSAGPFFEGKATTWEGGIRVPGIVRWPGKVPAGSVSTELVSTVDIFATAAALAGAEVPQDRIIDGKDLSGVLLRGEASSHECLFHYKGTPSMGFPVRKDDPQPGLWAVRCGAYKAHYVTQCSMMHEFGDTRCSSTLASAEDLVDGDSPFYGETRPSTPIVHSTPLLYNVEHDTNERYPIDSSSPEYAAVMATIMRAKREHEAAVTPVPNQMRLGGDVDLAVCCDPSSQEKFPNHLNCTCDPHNFDDVFVCSPVFEGKYTPPSSLRSLLV